MGSFIYIFQVSSSSAYTYLYNQYDRRIQSSTKNKGVFPTDDSLFKMLYLAMMDITKKWTGRRRDWGEIHSQLEIFFADRISY